MIEPVGPRRAILKAAFARNLMPQGRMANRRA
jgi:hypothetical protein